MFSVTFVLPVGRHRHIQEEVAFLIPGGPISRENAVLMARTFIVPEDLGTPPGAVSLRGATNFQTPPGWDTVYTPVFNMIERPVAPMLVVRVETDWYAHETEFRYVLQPGEGISGSHSLPIGQVLFVPREEITLRDCSEEELEAIKQSRQEFSRAKAALTRNTAYGLPYSPHYFQASRARNAPVRTHTTRGHGHARTSIGAASLGTAAASGPRAIRDGGVAGTTRSIGPQDRTQRTLPVRQRTEVLRSAMARPNPRFTGVDGAGVPAGRRGRAQRPAGGPGQAGGGEDRPVRLHGVR